MHASCKLVCWSKLLVEFISLFARSEHVPPVAKSDLTVTQPNHFVGPGMQVCKEASFSQSSWQRIFYPCPLLISLNLQSSQVSEPKKALVKHETLQACVLIKASSSVYEIVWWKYVCFPVSQIQFAFHTTHQFYWQQHASLQACKFCVELRQRNIIADCLWSSNFQNGHEAFRAEIFAFVAWCMQFCKLVHKSELPFEFLTLCNRSIQTPPHLKFNLNVAQNNNFVRSSMQA